MKPTVSIAALACAVTTTALPHAVLAQTVLPPPPSPAPVVMVEQTVLPNPLLFRGGIALFVVGFVPAATVGLFSDHKGDANLLIPVAGPWIDLGNRDCSGSTIWTGNGVVEVSSGSPCGTSGTQEAALIVDGVVQGLGALTVISSLLLPEHRLAAWATGSPSPSFSIGPTSFGGRGMGAVAHGQF